MLTAHDHYRLLLFGYLIPSDFSQNFKMVEHDSADLPPDVIASLPPFLQAQIPLLHENLQPNIYASLAVCHSLACAAVASRLYARRLKAQPLWWDDWLICVALVRQH